MQGGDIQELVNPEGHTHSGLYSQLSFLVFGVKWEIPSLPPNPIMLYYYYYHSFIWLLIGQVESGEIIIWGHLSEVINFIGKIKSLYLPSDYYF